MTWSRLLLESGPGGTWTRDIWVAIPRPYHYTTDPNWRNSRKQNRNWNKATKQNTQWNLAKKCIHLLLVTYYCSTVGLTMWNSLPKQLQSDPVHTTSIFGHFFSQSTSAYSALGADFLLALMRYINSRFTYLLTYLLTYLPTDLGFLPKIRLIRSRPSSRT